MNCRFGGSCYEPVGKSVVQQDFKPFRLILEDYLNGDISLPQADPGSFQFAQESDVDFNAEGINNHHDIFDVASGSDKVFPEAKPVEPSPAPSVEPSPAPSDVVSE